MFEGIKGIIRSYKSKVGQYNGQKDQNMYHADVQNRN
jgi:hypothetical protein